LKENCKKYADKIEKLKEKEVIWKSEMTMWYKRFSQHKDFSENHPEVQKYFEMKSQFDEKLAKLQTKYNSCINDLKRAEEDGPLKSQNL